MRTIANIFLILFLNAAGLGIAEALLGQKLGLSLLSALHDFAQGLAIFFGLVIYLGFAFNKHLPKKVLIPPIAFLFWAMLDFWPLENFSGNYYQLIAMVTQLLLGLLALQLNKQLNKKSRLLTLSQFTCPAFSGQNLFRFCLVNIPLMPLAVAILSFATVSNLIDEQSAGFMRLKPNGLYMVEKVYQKDSKTIRLASMIHLGQQAYFDSLSASLQGQQTLLLAEGVSDKNGRLQGEFSYQKIAELLGLTAQEQMLVDGRLINAKSLDQLDDRQIGKTDILPADIDLSEFNEQTISMLNALGRYVLNSDSLAAGFRKFNQWAKDKTSPETNQIVMDDLVQKRNRMVLSYLPKALRKYDILVIPWGALHMPGLETAVRHKGFTLRQQQERLSIDFLRLPYEKLWQQQSLSN